MTLILPGWHGVQKPPRGAMLDATHPLARGLSWGALINEGAGSLLRDITPRHDNASAVNTPFAWESSVHGTVLTLNRGGGTGYFLASNQALVTAGAAMSAAFRFSTTAAFTGATEALFSRSGDQFVVDSPAANALRLICSTSAGFKFTGNITGFTVGPWYDVLAVYGDNGNLNFYVNGVLRASVTNAGATITMANKLLTLGTNAGTLTRVSKAQFEYAYFWTARALTASDAAQLATEPYAIIQAPAYRRYYSFSSAPHFRRAGSLRSGSRDIAQHVIGV